MPDAASTAAVQPPPFILDLRNRSPPASPSQVASDAARSSSPSSLGESEGTASTNATSEAPSDPLREQIIAGLIGSPKPTVPGKTEKDRAYAYRRTIPTMTLYSERGLSIYEEITKTKVCTQLPCRLSALVHKGPMLSQQRPSRLSAPLAHCTRACPSSLVAAKQSLEQTEPADLAFAFRIRPTIRSKRKKRSSKTTETKLPAACLDCHRPCSSRTAQFLVKTTSTSRLPLRTGARRKKSGEPALAIYNGPFHRSSAV